MPRIAFLIITWFFWVLFAQGAVYSAVFLTSPSERTNTFASPNLLLSVGSLLVLALVGGGIRLLLTKLQNQWAILLLSIVGIVIAQAPVYFGAFLAPEFKIVYQGLSVLLFVAYIPNFLFPKQAEMLPA